MTEQRYRTWRFVHPDLDVGEEGVSVRLLLEHLGERERMSPNSTLPGEDGESQVAFPILRAGARLHVTCQGVPSAPPCRLAVVTDSE